MPTLFDNMQGFRPRVLRDRDFRGKKILFSDGQDPVGDEFGKRLVNYIPSEVVGAYVVVAGLVEGLITQDKGFFGLSPIRWLWIAVSAFAILSCIYTFVATARPTQWFQVFTAPIAFLAWSFALGGPFKVAMSDYNPAAASIVLVLVSVAIPAIDKLVDKLSTRT